MGNCQAVQSDKANEQNMTPAILDECTNHNEVLHGGAPETLRTPRKVEHSQPEEPNNQLAIPKEEEKEKESDVQEEKQITLSLQENEKQSQRMPEQQQATTEVAEDNHAITTQEKEDYIKGIKDKTDPKAFEKLEEQLKALGFTVITNKENFDTAIAKVLSEQFKPAPKRVLKVVTNDTTPRVATIDDVIAEVLTKSHIVVLTGAGLSVASGIPTFRGEGGYWTVRDKNKLKASDFLTHSYFKKNPKEIWRWHHEFRKVMAKSSPNVSHHALAEFQVFCKQNNRKFTLITQNVDGYHIDAYVQASAKHNLVTLKRDGLKVPPKFMKKFGLCEDIYEIHGSAHYMRCDKGCKTELFPSPDVGCADDFVDKCPNCRRIARPHTLFFDEFYDENYYRTKMVMKEIKSMDCLIVIGTALETSMASQIVDDMKYKKGLIVEINPNPCIKGGNVRYLVGGAEKFVPDLFEAVQKELSMMI